MKTFTLLLTLMACSYLTQAQVFVDVNAGLPGLANTQSIDWGDYDNDGDLDLLIAGQNPPPGLTPVCKLYKYENLQFTEVSLNTAPKYRAAIKWLDYDNDGDLDFILSGADSYFGQIRTYLIPNDNNTFSRQIEISDNGGFLVCGDIDADGDTDILSSGALGSSNLSILRNDCTNDSIKFFAVSAPFIPLKISTAILADLDGDNLLDIIASGEGEEIADYHIRIYRNDSQLNFTLMPVNLPAIRGWLSTADYDNDNDPDILISGVHNYNEPITRIFRNDNSTFTELSESLPQIIGPSTFADVDNDSDADIIIAGISGLYPDFTTVTCIVKNDGNDSFTAMDPVTTPLNGGSLAAGDYDADGDIDFAVTGSTSFTEPDYNTIVYANNYILSDEKETLHFAPLQFALLYPNPVAGTLKIQLKEPATQLTLTIHTISGRLLQTTHHQNCTQIEENISSLPPGVYLLTVSTAYESKSYKICKE